MRPLITLFAMFFSVGVFAQTQQLSANELRALRRLMVNGVWIDSISVDTTLSAATNTKLATALAVKKYVKRAAPSFSRRSVGVTPGGVFVTMSGTMPTNFENVHFYRGPARLFVGGPGCNNCGVVWEAANSRFVLFRAYASGEKIEISILQ